MLEDECEKARQGCQQFSGPNSEEGLAFADGWAEACEHAKRTREDDLNELERLAAELATERAAREAAETDRELLRAAAKTFETAGKQAESELDTALALLHDLNVECVRRLDAIKAAEERVKELEADRSWYDKGFTELRESNALLHSDVATERAAREAAEIHNRRQAEARVRAEAECDAALARVTALEYWKACHEGDAERALAAETALASARELISRAANWKTCNPWLNPPGLFQFIQMAEAWLSSHTARKVGSNA